MTAWKVSVVRDSILQEKSWMWTESAADIICILPSEQGK